jgi:two-component system, OmpR family, response regulator
MEPHSSEPMSNSQTYVLIVDDDFSIRDLLGKFLSTKGISCLTAASAEEAISLLRTSTVALVLLDWGLQGPMDGDGALVLQFCKLHLPSLPVIVISGQVFEPGADAPVNQADGFVPKPFELKSIADLVFHWLNRGEVRV